MVGEVAVFSLLVGACTLVTSSDLAARKDRDGDGFVAEQFGGDDCDDDDASVSPEGVETWYDGTDQDCDGASDFDADGDGYDAERGGGPDCDDGDAARSPAAAETCNGLDDDCDGALLDGEGDADGDGFLACDALAPDCDDTDAAVHPDAVEVCDPDDVDEDCNDFADDEDGGVTGTTTWYADADGDAWGDDNVTSERCEQPTDYVELGGDCDDDDAAVHPETVWTVDEDADGWAPEVGDTLQQCEQPEGYVLATGDCDDADPSLHPETEWFRDDDGDGYGDPEASSEACEPDATYAWVQDDTDCDDTDAEVHVSATEVCDEVDNDCDGLVDDQDDVVADQTTWYLDGDGDGWGDDGDALVTCELPTGRVTAGGDCDDGDATVSPGATEVCNAGVDDDCDGRADDDDEDVAGQDTWYVDADGDGYGLADSPLASCGPGTGFSLLAGDCDDGDASVSPAETETWYDGVDQDCDGASDFDADADGQTSSDHGGPDCDDDDSTVYAGATETWYDGVDQDCGGDDDYDRDGDGYSSSDFGGDDCNDGAAAVNPGAEETWYDGLDGDCDGGTDFDADLDGYEASAYGGDDCDDTSAAVSPSASEICGDGLDNDCDGAASGCGLFDGASVTASYDYLIEGVAAGASAGSYFAGLGDTDGDGSAELGVAANGADPGGLSSAGTLYVLRGPVTGDADLSLSAAMVHGETSGTGAGVPCGPGDLDGDGTGDLVYAHVNEGNGSAYVFLGPVTTELTTSDAELVLEAADSYGDPGRGCAAQDADSDGDLDLLLGAPGSDEVYLLQGPVTAMGTHVVTDVADIVVSGEASGDDLGYAVAALGDTDGDGFGDMLVGAPSENSENATAYPAFDQGGAAYVLLGPLTTDMSVGDADWKLHGAESQAFIGRVVAAAGDMDGDGLADLALASPNTDAGASDAGRVYVVHGPVTADGEIDGDAVISGERGSGELGYTLGGGTDIDGDTHADLVIGGAGTGAVYVGYGPLSGSLGASELLSLPFGANDEHAWSPGDIDGDGYADLAAVDMSADPSGRLDAGAIYLLRGGVGP